MMLYPFRCPKCGHEERISMKMTEYTASGHMCPECKTEMERPIESCICACAIDQTGDFYRRTN